MNQWWRHLKGRPFYWVLDGSTPAADWFMLRYVVERPDKSRSLRAARLALVESAPVVALKRRLSEEALPLMTLRLLAELDVPGNDEQIAEALDRVLEERWTIELAPILLHIAFTFGFSDEERLQPYLAMVDSRLRNSAPNDETKWVNWLLLSAMALAEQPAFQREEAVLSALGGHLQALHPQKQPAYGCYAFPVYLQPDDLVLAQAALRLGMGGEWLRPWVERIEAAQDEKGLWRFSRQISIPDRIDLGEKVGLPSRLVSARALYVLRAFYGE